MRFPQVFIDDLRRQADIVRVISDYVTLKKKGANWMACCPFHQEKSPSFSVSPSKGIFYCFGCGQKGNVIGFVMEMERVSFPEAVRIVAEKSGVPLPELVDDRGFEARRKEADEVVQLNAWALEFWERQLLEGAEGKAAREYVAGRGISDETRQAFRLGYAPDSWDALGNYLKGKGASIAQIERSGLVVRKDAGGYYDRFRGRVIFPVMDAQGRPVAFGARAIRAGDEPKYLNSPETAAYTKGRHLFGLNVSREEIRRKKFVILVEGYLDLIVPYQFGVRNVVASLGTALTPEQVRLLGRFARKVVVNYDGDKAGVKAAKRAIETLLAEDFEIKVLVLPEGADPDEFLRAHGADEYNRRRGEAFPYIQFVIEQAIREHNIHNPTEKSEAVNEVLPFIRAVRNRIQQREYFDTAMDSLRVDDRSLRRELWKTVSANTAVDGGVIKQKIVQAGGAKPTDAERRLLTLLLHDDELRHKVLPLIEPSVYEELPTASVFHALKELDAKASEISFESLCERAANPFINDFIANLWVSEPQRAEGEAIDDVVTAAECCLLAIKCIGADEHIKRINAAMKHAESTNNLDEFRRLQSEQWEWTKYQKELKAAFASVDVVDTLAFGILEN